MGLNSGMAVTEEMETVRIKASLFTLHHHHHPHRSPSLGAAVNIRLSPFLQLSPISLSTRVCVRSVPLRVLHPLCTDGELHLTPPLCVCTVKTILHFRIDSLSRTRPPRASLPFAISLATKCLSNRREVVMGT
ncbi:hypothetical protein DPX16_17447 [Anabarilius grahami]|uniref:Uncharacterized protein n=1 Tax=Anabarilius grahami TaxID=495550 RepID=A0A3N0XYZ9_ANAGA|nr:hypothetical protein DPX16_17447 [Anabarilius grahami]